MAEKNRVEVVFATPRQQLLVEVELDDGATVDDAIRASEMQSHCDERIEDCPVGIWGRVVEKTQAVKDGDRVEIYRPLERDPRDARRELAKAQRFGSSS